MNILVPLFFSLVLTSLVGFMIPIVLAIVLLGSLSIVAHLDTLAIWADVAFGYICNFLAIFGEGSPLDGVIMIAIVSSIAGLLFEFFNFYRHHLLIDQNSPASCLQRQKLTDFFTKLSNRSNSQK